MDSATLKEHNQFGKDFLTYLCYKSDENEGRFTVTGQGQLLLLIGDKIVLEDSGDAPRNSVSYSGEAFTGDDLKQAIRSGKKVCEAQFKIEKDTSTWSFTMKAQRFDISGLRMYPPTYKSDDPEGRFYGRMLSIEQLHSIIDELYHQFLRDISGKHWEDEGYKKFQKWLNP